MTTMHAFTTNLYAAARRTAAAPGEIPGAPAGAGKGAAPVPPRDRPAGPVPAFRRGRPAARAGGGRGIFRVTNDCTSCGTCTAACPAGNITMTKKRPAWRGNCRLCFSCIRTCPVQAIRIG